MFYKNSDYTIRMVVINGFKRYFIKFHSQDESPEQEISLDIFMLYLKEFNKPLERQKTERRRHIACGDYENLIAASKSAAHTGNEVDFILTKCAVETVLCACTHIQQRRYELHYIQGYSFTEIAKLEQCDESAIRRSVMAVIKKIKIIFKG